MTISAALVKELRERTGAGMMECKKALVEANGDLDAAAEVLRISGQAKADKKASRIAAEGRVVVAEGNDEAVLRYNTCVRTINWHRLVAAQPDEQEPQLE